MKENQAEIYSRLNKVEQEWFKQFEAALQEAEEATLTAIAARRDAETAVGATKAK